MSQLFDLNVNSYSLRELLDFFELTSNDDGALVLVHRRSALASRASEGKR